MQEELEVTSLFTVDDVTLVCAHEELAASEPAMASVLATNVLLLFVQTTLMDLHVVGLSQLIVLEGLWTCYQDKVCVNITETDLSAQNMAGTLGHDLLSNAALLIPLPNEDMLVGDVGQGHE